MTVTDDRQEEVPDAAPLPAEPSPPDAEPDGEQHDQEHEQDADTPPPLPPLLETGASTLATAGSGLYAAAGPAGLMAAAGIATVAGVAYGIRHHQNKKNAAGTGAGRGPGGGRGRFFGSPALGGGRAGRSARSGAMSGRSGGRGAGSGLAGGRHRSSRAGSGALTGAGGRTSRGSGGRGAFGSSGSSGRGGSRGLFGSGTSRAGGHGAGSGGGLLGSTGSSRSGRSAAGRGGGLFGSAAGSRSAGSSRRSPGRRAAGGGLFGGGAAGRSARRARGRSTAITDPAIPTGSGRGPIRRAVRRGWEHPRAHRARVRARKGWHKSRVRTRRMASRARVRIRSHSQRLGDYLRKRKWALRVRGWGTSFSDWWSRLWDGLRGRASDPRYGRLKGWQLTAAAAAIGALGAGKKKTTPRPPLVGRIIGTAAPTPGDAGPLTIAGRTLLALTTGEGEAPLAPEVQRVKDAAEEMKAALALLGGSQVGMLTYEQGLKELGPVLGIIADGLKDMATTAEDEQPLDGSVLEFFGTIEDAARGASQVADEMPGLFRAAHEVELERLENPRRGEEKWDVSQQH